MDRPRVISIYARERMRITLLLFVVLCLSCSKSDDEKTANVASSTTASPSPSPSRIASCDRVAAMSYCAEYSGSYLAQNELALSGSCKKLNGAFVVAECPNTAVLGACTLPTGEVRKLYSSGEAAFDAARAQKECATAYHGVWK
jgi:hypothetical protein